MFYVPYDSVAKYALRCTSKIETTVSLVYSSNTDMPIFIAQHTHFFALSGKFDRNYPIAKERQQTVLCGADLLLPIIMYLCAIAIT